MSNGLGLVSARKILTDFEKFLPKEGSVNMYNKEMFYTFFATIRDSIEDDLKKNNKGYNSVQKKLSELWDSVSEGVSKETYGKILNLEEELAARQNIVEEAVYLKGLEDGFKLIAFMTQGDVIKKYCEFTNQETPSEGSTERMPNIRWL